MRSAAQARKGGMKTRKRARREDVRPPSSPVPRSSRPKSSPRSKELMRSSIGQVTTTGARKGREPGGVSEG